MAGKGSPDSELLNYACMLRRGLLDLTMGEF